MSGMKPSGVEWIGDIPEEWALNRIGRLFKIVGGNGFRPELQGRSSEKYPFFKCSDISDSHDCISYAVNSVTEQDVANEGYNVIPAYSILMSKIGESMKKNRRALNINACCIDNNMQALVPNDDLIFPLYALEVLKNIDASELDNGGPVPSINNIKFRTVLVPLPSLVEQQAIADYLDVETAKIDKAISLLQEQLSTLEAYKRSLIHETVTKGLNPNVPMKPSGVEWIGDIPEGWAINKLKYISRSFNDNLTTEDIFEDGLYAVFGAAGLMGFNDSPTMRESYIGIVKDGAGVGRTNTYPPNTSLLATMSYIIPFSFINLSWLKYCIDSLELGKSEDKTTIPHIYFSKYGNRLIPFLTYSEQQAIADYLDSKCEVIDKVLATKREQIEMLTKQRQSLIYEYVTGKRRVN